MIFSLINRGPYPKTVWDFFGVQYSNIVPYLLGDKHQLTFANMTD
jgi:hypothetical protein